MATCVDEVSEVVRGPERSLVIGWPTINVVVTFDSVDMKRQFETELKRYLPHVICMQSSVILVLNTFLVEILVIVVAELLALVIVIFL